MDGVSERKAEKRGIVSLGSAIGRACRRPDGGDTVKIE